MAQRVQVLMTCDMDEDDVEAVETVTFGYDGYTYAFELCEEHLDEFNNQMQEFIGVARKADGNGSGRRRSSSRQPTAEKATAPSAKEDLGAIREWARGNGYTVADRGRISTEIREAYAASH